VYPHRARRNSRRRPASRGPVRRLCLVVAGTSVPVLVIASAVMAAHREQEVETASVSTPGGWAPGAEAGGWGRGGYMMMPGPAGPPSSASAPSPAAQRNAANAAAVTSENWAGYVSAGRVGTFTSVSASWTEPAVTCTSTNTFSSFWVGLDGDGTDTVEQTGTEADCDGGAATYQGWFEMFPNASVFFGNLVQPGDAMSASVVAAGGGAFTLTLTDSTQGWTRITNQTSGTAQLGSAEVIVEAPSDGTGAVLPLSNFGAVSFTGAAADNTAIGNENPGALTMVSANDVTEATPSALADGSAFAVTWEGNGTTAPTSPASGTAPGPAPGTGGTPGRHHRHRHHWSFGG
jgi:Peptidase A4 family